MVCVISTPAVDLEVLALLPCHLPFRSDLDLLLHFSAAFHSFLARMITSPSSSLRSKAAFYPNSASLHHPALPFASPSKHRLSTSILLTLS
jgi:hypothetical protein